MAGTLQECPHCLTKIFYDENGRCPCCRKNKDDKPLRKKEEILLDNEISGSGLVIADTLRTGVWEVIGGVSLIALILAFNALTFVTQGKIVAIRFMIIALAVSVGLVAKGLADLHEVKKMKREYSIK
jgi:hypothetical protein